MSDPTLTDLVADEPAEAPAEAPLAAPPFHSGLCLSGGGYRAMLFHLGTLWRLNEAGRMRRLERISSVSGGSITSATLASRWSGLTFDADGVATDFVEHVVSPVRALAGRTIDVGAVLTGLLWTGSVGNRVAAAYDRHLFHGKTLQDLPEPGSDAPLFIINATNLQSAVLWRFNREKMGDYRVGYILQPTLSLAEAVAASSAFPPILAPITLRFDPASFEGGGDLQDPAYRRRVRLADGGVYDNLGLERVWKRCEEVLVSDAGKGVMPEDDVTTNWLGMTFRVVNVIDRQVRALRVRETIASYKAPPADESHREGAYWGIRSNIENYKKGQPDLQVLPCPHAATLKLASTPTRLARLDARLQERLINWGYAVTDAALRRHVDASIPMGAFPYPAVGVG